MHKAQRLIHMMMIVNEKKHFTIREMVEELGVSRRTIIRDLMELSELGVPLYSEVGASGGYRLLREKILPPISFTENEALALFFASQSLKNYKSLPFENEVSSALHKFYQFLSSDIKRKIDRLKSRLMFWVPPRDMVLPFLQPLLEAALEQTVLTIEYVTEGVEKKRNIQPIGIYTMNGLWYCQANCFLKNENRVFRVDRLRSLSICPDQSRRMDTKQDMIEHWIMHLDERDKVDLEVLLTPRGARRCKTDPWLSEVLVIHDDGSAWIKTQMSSTYIDWAVHFFLGYGKDVIVFKPEELRDRIRDELEELIMQYEEKREGRI